MSADNILTIIITVLGSGGIGAIISTLINSRKVRADSLKVEQESSCIKVDNEIKSIDYINNQLRSLSEAYKNESSELRRRNDELSNRITDMQSKLQELMQWIVKDNQNYRQWLETELRRVNPDVDFPECPDPPNVFND